MTRSVRAASLTNFFEVARARGLNPLPLLRQVGLSRALLDDPDQRIPAGAVIELLELAAQASGDPNFGLRLAQSRQVSDFGAVSLLIAHQTTLRDALRVTIAYRHLINDSLALDLEEDGDFVTVRAELVAGLASRQSTELALGVVMRLCIAVLGAGWRPYSVNFTHRAPKDVALHQRLFDCRLEFGSEFNGLVCRGADLDAPNRAAAPDLARHAQRFLESLPQEGAASLEQEVRKAIHLLLGSGNASSAYVAQGLGLSVRTLQRRLDEAGVSFTDLLNEVRRELVQRHLENPRHSLVRISQMLGYSSPSAFTRWFSSQFGEPPQQWRARRYPSSPSSRY